MNNHFQQEHNNCSYNSEYNHIKHYLPSFLINEILKEDSNNNSVLLIDEREEEAHEIKMDSCYFKNVRNCIKIDESI